MVIILLALLLFKTNIIYVRSALWPCPGKCWNNVDVQGNPTVQSQLQPLWQSPCPTCDSLPGYCPYGTYAQTVRSGAYACVSCQSRMLQQLNRVMAPTQPSNCSEAVSTSMCAKGYFLDNTYSYAFINNLSASVDPCVPCLSAAVDCPAGTYPSVCLRDLVSDMCLPCAAPTLPSAMYAYGRGFAYDDCSALQTPTCAWFQTPKWGGGYCMVQCAAGYATIRAAASPFELPVCQLCATSCSTPGYYPPPCGMMGGGDTPDCQPCDPGLLPDNAHWVNGCEWACNEKGFYFDSNQCVPCVRGASCQQGEVFIGCYGSNPGRCTACAITCPSNGYLRTDIYLPACACANCSHATLGATFVISPCTQAADAVLGSCRQCEAGVSYASAPCTLHSDTVCTACTAPGVGRLLVSQCTSTSDAVYAACPAGLACNGSAWTSPCPADKVGVRGVCVCPPATTNVSDMGACSPIPCSAGMFPNPLTGGCSWCNTTASSVITSRGGSLGFEASCGCIQGFFRAVDPSVSSISCWPCGDLACDPAVQRQIPFCDGFGTVEPSCVCALGPGVALIWPPSLYAEQRCAIRCADGFSPLSGPSPGLYDQYSYISLGAGAAITMHAAAACFLSSSPTPTGSILFGTNALLVLCDDGNVAIVRTDTGESKPLDLSHYLEVAGLRTQIKATALKPHSAMPGLAWIAFTFWGHCDVYIDDPESRDCSAIELLSVTLSSECELGVCLLLVIML